MDSRVFEFIENEILKKNENLFEILNIVKFGLK